MVALACPLVTLCLWHLRTCKFWIGNIRKYYTVCLISGQLQSQSNLASQMELSIKHSGTVVVHLETVTGTAFKCLSLAGAPWDRQAKGKSCIDHATSVPTVYRVCTKSAWATPVSNETQ